MSFINQKKVTFEDIDPVVVCEISECNSELSGDENHTSKFDNEKKELLYDYRKSVLSFLELENECLKV